MKKRVKYLYQCCTAELPYSYKLFTTRRAMESYLRDKVVIIKQRIIIDMEKQTIKTKDLWKITEK